MGPRPVSPVSAGIGERGRGFSLCWGRVDHYNVVEILFVSMNIFQTKMYITWGTNFFIKVCKIKIIAICTEIGSLQKWSFEIYMSAFLMTLKKHFSHFVHKYVWKILFIKNVCKSNEISPVQSCDFELLRSDISS